ncbi:hypothetical protein [Streptomyces agglomeratus]|nr:hypothetical protein [Streptomyces agglomeratus]
MLLADPGMEEVRGGVDPPQVVQVLRLQALGVYGLELIVLDEHGGGDR